MNIPFSPPDISEEEIEFTYECENGNIICFMNEQGIKIKLDKDKFDLLFVYDDLKDTEIISVEPKKVVYRHNGLDYAIALNNASFAEENRGYRIKANSNEFEMTFIRANNNA